MIKECVELARQIQDKEKESFAVAGILAFTELTKEELMALEEDACKKSIDTPITGNVAENDDL